jgi:hypothetical protein
MRGVAARAADTTVMRRPGNQSARTHGFYSQDKNVLKLRARAVRRLVAAAYKVCPWLTDTDIHTVRSWAEVVKLKAAAFAALEKTGPFAVRDGDLQGRKLLSDYERLSKLELAYAERLGLTPTSRIQLGVDVARGRVLNAAEEIARAKAVRAVEGKADDAAD